MTVQECYESMGSNFEDVLGRMGSEAFRAAHTLKGICLNLGLDRLYRGSACLTEKLRGREFDGYEEAYSEVQQEYRNTVDIIRTMAE